MLSTPRRVLVATDFSSAADAARALGEALAVRFEAELHLVHVRVLLEDPHLAAEHGLAVERLMELSEDPAREALRSTAAEAGVAARPHLVRGISASEAVVETAAELGCDLILAGTHGRRGLKHLLLGSVAEEIVRTAPAPVIAVRDGWSLPPSGFSGMVVSHDFSERSSEAVRLAGAWAAKLGAAVHLVHVVEPVVYPEFYAVDVMPRGAVGQILERARTALESAASELLPGLEVTTEVRRGHAAEEIVAAADPARHQLVVMATRGLSGFEHLLLGSVAENVLRRCPLPLMTVRSGE